MDDIIQDGRTLIIRDRRTGDIDTWTFASEETVDLILAVVLGE